MTFKKHRSHIFRAKMHNCDALSSQKSETILTPDNCINPLSCLITHHFCYFFWQSSVCKLWLVQVCIVIWLNGHVYRNCGFTSYSHEITCIIFTHRVRSWRNSYVIISELSSQTKLKFIFRINCQLIPLAVPEIKGFDR